MEIVVSSELEWIPLLEERGTLDREVVEMILTEHGSRGRTAIESVGEQRVKRYRDFIVVVGHGSEHIVESGNCLCEDVQYNLDRDDPAQKCWHELAVIIAESVGAVDEHDLWYSDVHDFFE